MFNTLFNGLGSTLSSSCDANASSHFLSSTACFCLPHLCEYTQLFFRMPSWNTQTAKSRSQGLPSSCQLCQICSWSLDYVKWDVCNSHYWTHRLKIKTQCALLCGCRLLSLPSAPPGLAGDGSKAEGSKWAARRRCILAALRASETLKWASTVMGRPGKKESGRRRNSHCIANQPLLVRLRELSNPAEAWSSPAPDKTNPMYISEI